jgi:hypothetical protein
LLRSQTGKLPTAKEKPRDNSALSSRKASRRARESRSAEFPVNLRQQPSQGKKYLHLVREIVVLVRFENARSWIVLEQLDNPRALSGIERGGFS